MERKIYKNMAEKRQVDNLWVEKQNKACIAAMTDEQLNFNKREINAEINRRLQDDIDAIHA